MDVSARSAADDPPPHTPDILPANVDDPRFGRDPEPEQLHPWGADDGPDPASWVLWGWGLDAVWGLSGQLAAAVVHALAWS